MTVPARMTIFDFDYGATIPSSTARRWSKMRKAGRVASTGFRRTRKNRVDIIQQKLVLDRTLASANEKRE